MPNWNHVLREIQNERDDPNGESASDKIRHKYLLKLHEHTGRNVIAYYSGWLSKPKIEGIEINDEDKNGFMLAIHSLDRAKGLDLFLHTPGGSVAATASLVHYLRQMFGNDIRAFVPQLAMSAGTMIACSCREVFLGKHSTTEKTLQDLVLTAHHCFMYTLSNTSAFKIIENHMGRRYVKLHQQQVLMQIPASPLAPPTPGRGSLS